MSTNKSNVRRLIYYWQLKAPQCDSVDIDHVISWSPFSRDMTKTLPLFTAFTRVETSVLVIWWGLLWGCRQILSRYTQLQKKVYTARKYSKPSSCRTRDGMGDSSSEFYIKHTEFMKRFNVVPKFGSKAWRHALCQPVTQKSMAEVLGTLEPLWCFFTNPGFIVAELGLAVSVTCQGFCSTYIVTTH